MTKNIGGLKFTIYIFNLERSFLLFSVSETWKEGISKLYRSGGFYWLFWWKQMGLNWANFWCIALFLLTS